MNPAFTFGVVSSLFLILAPILSVTCSLECPKTIVDLHISSAFSALRCLFTVDLHIPACLLPLDTPYDHPESLGSHSPLFSLASSFSLAINSYTRHDIHWPPIQRYSTYTPSPIAKCRRLGQEPPPKSPASRFWIRTGRTILPDVGHWLDTVPRLLNTSPLWQWPLLLEGKSPPRPTPPRLQRWEQFQTCPGPCRSPRTQPAPRPVILLPAIAS